MVYDSNIMVQLMIPYMISPRPAVSLPYNTPVAYDNPHYFLPPGETLELPDLLDLKRGGGDCTIYSGRGFHKLFAFIKNGILTGYDFIYYGL